MFSKATRSLTRLLAPSIDHLQSRIELLEAILLSLPVNICCIEVKSDNEISGLVYANHVGERDYQVMIQNDGELLRERIKAAKNLAPKPLIHETLDSEGKSRNILVLNICTIGNQAGLIIQTKMQQEIDKAADMQEVDEISSSFAHQSIIKAEVTKPVVSYPSKT